MSQETIRAAERAAGQVKTMSTYDPDSDQLHEECGIFGVWAPDRDVARLTYFGLRALQHRGQESAGIVSYDGKSSPEDFLKMADEEMYRVKREKKASR